MDPNLCKAVKSKDIDFIKIIAQDTEQPSLSDKTPELNRILHLAVASSDDDHQFVQGSLEIQLCQKFVTEKNSNGDLPLHVAPMATFLLVKLSNEQLKDHCDCVPLVEKNMEENATLHLALIKKFQVGRNSALKAKYNKVAKFLVEKCLEVSYYPNKERESPIYLAAEGGDEKLVKLMITTNRLPYSKSIVHAAIYYLRTISNLPYGKSIVCFFFFGQQRLYH
ncbi:uncharacterized protein LOC126727717 [Quercus robur]|uniref:uncharacterized protein LOC126727717 n=1 Tax=Quercus robur TaxID=38942 RepID=UPI0021638536|nr:uncharacterized protein LOC126727717 [Quercus robur]